MGSLAAGKNSGLTATWIGTATTAAGEVVTARGTGSLAPARTITLFNSGGTAMLFSLDDSITWLPLAPGQSFDWDREVYAISVKTAAGSTTYALVAGY